VKFGAHLSTAGGIDTAIDRAAAIKADCVQVFTQSPRMWKHTVHAPDAIERFKAKRAAAGIGGVVCHALYLCNLGASDSAIYDKSVTALCATVDAAVAIEADGVVFHVGSHLGGGLDAGMKQIVRAMKKILKRCKGDTWLLIENSAGAGGTIGRSIPELAQLIDALDGHERLGICLDSCHLYASGYDVTDRAVLDELVAGVDELIGLDRLRALHINDSAVPFGSNRDRHADVLAGEMGKGLGVFLAHPAFQGLDAYLETPGPDGHGPVKADLTRVRRLHTRALAAAGAPAKKPARRAARSKRR
jgi:deoxyribonuclease-4